MCARDINTVVLSEGLDKRRMEGGEDVWGGRNVKSHRRHLSMYVRDKVRAIEPGHEFGNPSFLDILVFSVSSISQSPTLSTGLRRTPADIWRTMTGQASPVIVH